MKLGKITKKIKNSKEKINKLKGNKFENKTTTIIDNKLIKHLAYLPFCFTANQAIVLCASTS